MVKVTISTVDERKTVMAAESATIREILDSNSINYTRATLMIDGIILDANTVNSSLESLHAGEECTIACSVKMDNA